MPKQFLLSPKQISKSTPSGKMKPTPLFDENDSYDFVFLRYHNSQLSSLFRDSAKLPNLKKDQKRLVTEGGVKS